MGSENRCAFRDDEGNCTIAENCADIAYLNGQNKLGLAGLDPELIEELARRGWGVPFYACSSQSATDAGFPIKWGCLVEVKKGYDIKKCPYFLIAEQLGQYPYMQILLKPLKLISIGNKN